MTQIDKRHKDPSSLRRAICAKFRRFANFAQHDSQELMCSLLDGLHEDLNQSAMVNGKLPRVFTPANADSWELHLANNSSPIVDIFHGNLYSSIECQSCGNKETVHDPFMFLSLDIPCNKYSVSLGNCLAAFSCCERLDATNKWKCDRCQNRVCATKTMGVHRCGQVLIVHLKRFAAARLAKVDTRVDYPDVLDSATFAEEPTGKYRLIGAVFHNGGLGGGHYTAAAFDLTSRGWFNFNDTIVTPIDKSAAHKSNAYILVYERM
jgi:ubiquitin C-terminal hydrolase